jgi:CRISPR/Cas system type I-B associated protein Csh2 (Cas7 group RAMP superfamily)
MKLTVVQPDGTSEVRDMNADEIAAYETMQASDKVQTELKATKASAKQTVLDKLGLTQDEAQALLG